MIDKEGLLKAITNRDPHLGKLLETLFDGIDSVANHIGVDPNGKTQPPDPIKGLNVKAGTDHVHVTLTDPSPVRKNVQYFVEYSANDPTFQNAHMEHFGATRGKPLALPAKDDAGVAINYYFRAYSQYHGSDAQPQKTFFGDSINPTPVTLSGSSRLTLLPSPGGGTAPHDGSRPGLGLGTDLQRLPVGPKVPAPPLAK